MSIFRALPLMPNDETAWDNHTCMFGWFEGKIVYTVKDPKGRIWDVKFVPGTFNEPDVHRFMQEESWVNSFFELTLWEMTVR